MTVEDYVTTALDTIALLALALGVILGLWPLISGWSIGCGAVVVWFGVRIIDGSLARWVGQLRRSP